jgi:hypothetical protein
LTSLNGGLYTSNLLTDSAALCVHQPELVGVHVCAVKRHLLSLLMSPWTLVSLSKPLNMLEVNRYRLCMSTVNIRPPINTISNIMRPLATSFRPFWYYFYGKLILKSKKNLTKKQYFSSLFKVLWPYYETWLAWQRVAASNLYTKSHNSECFWLKMLICDNLTFFLNGENMTFFCRSLLSVACADKSWGFGTNKTKKREKSIGRSNWAVIL